MKTIMFTFAIACYEFNIIGADFFLLRLTEFNFLKEQCPHVVTEAVCAESAFEIVTCFDACR